MSTGTHRTRGRQAESSLESQLYARVGELGQLIADLQNRMANLERAVATIEPRIKGVHSVAMQAQARAEATRLELGQVRAAYDRLAGPTQSSLATLGQSMILLHSRVMRLEPAPVLPSDRDDTAEIGKAMDAARDHETVVVTPAEPA